MVIIMIEDRALELGQCFLFMMEDDNNCDGGFVGDHDRGDHND